MRKKTAAALVFMLVVSVGVNAANITSISNVQIIPTSPSPGDTVELRWDYSVDSAFNQPAALAVISDTNTLRPASTSGQWVMLGNGCTTPGSPGTAQVTGGCVLGSNIAPAGTHSNTESRTVNFTIPSTLVPGYTYYVIVGMKDYNCYMNPSVDVQVQNYVSFYIPLPPPYITLNKVAQGSVASPGGLVLYTIFYDVANTNNVVITDALPAEVDFVEAYDGGTFSGGTVTWSIGNVTSPVKGSVSYLARVKSSVTAPYVIHNTASATSSGANATSNDAPVTIGVSLKIGKFGAPAAVAVGDTLTFTLAYTNEGYALSSYTDFGPTTSLATDWSVAVPGATWTIGSGRLQGTGPTSQWGKIVKNTPIQHDAMYITDVYVPSTNPTGDAAFLFNFVDIGNMYHARIQTDTNQLCFDKVVSTTWSTIQCVTPAGFTMQNNAWYTIKVQVSGSDYKLKVWPKADPEPTWWNIQRTDSSIVAAGKAGYQDNEGDDWFDNLKIFTAAPATHIQVWDTLPSCITYAGCNFGCAYNAGTNVVSWDFPGTYGNTVNAVSFWARADACASGTYVQNTGCVDSDEPAPSVCSGIATIQVGPIDTATFTHTFTPTVTNTSTITYTPTGPPPTATDTFTPTLSYTVTDTQTPSQTHTASNTFTQTYTATQTPTPVPANLVMALEAVDISATAGGYAKIKLTINNTGDVTAEQVVIWDSVPAKTSFDPAYLENSGWVLASGIISRNVPDIPAGGTVVYYFHLKADENIAANQTVIVPAVMTSYSDFPAPSATSVLHALSNTVSIAIGRVVVFPNPFNPKKAAGGVLKVLNVPKGAKFTVYTLSGEHVISMDGTKSKLQWNGKSVFGGDCSPGIYYYIIMSADNVEITKGKLFLVWN